jgi:uncharacterized repeat protein (TIGR03803 family)
METFMGQLGTAEPPALAPSSKSPLPARLRPWAALPSVNMASTLMQGCFNVPTATYTGPLLTGARAGFGNVLQVTPGTLKRLASFDDSDGSLPTGTLVEVADGALYGTTQNGGSTYAGTVFSIKGETLTTVHTFDFTDGSPYAGLLQTADGNFYGTTVQGGANGYGTVYEMTPSGTLTTLHSFDSTDGANPYSALIHATDGYLYGTTTAGERAIMARSTK